MEAQIPERKLQLRKKALALQPLVEEYYRSKGLIHPKGLDHFLGRIAELLLGDKISPQTLRDSDFGIFRMVTDDFELEHSELGETVLDFGLELRKLADMLEQEE